LLVAEAGAPDDQRKAPILDVSGASVAFGGLQALDGVSVSVEQGAIVGLIGPNGAGKTTLFNVISGLQKVDRGAIRLEGRDITQMMADRRATLGIGRSFQNLGLMMGESVEDNLLAAQHLAVNYRGWDIIVRPWRFIDVERELRKKAVNALKVFGLPASYGQKTLSELSFAGARFVELACVLVGQPRLMLLDEPTTGLDIREVDRLLAVLSELRQGGTTILLVAHDVRFVMGVCDYVYVLADGRLLFEGLPGAVQENPAVIEAYLGRPAT